MQCPVCEQDAPVAAFGDPLRCPECGVFYEKAVQLKARREAGANMRPELSRVTQVAKSSREQKGARSSVWLAATAILLIGLLVLAEAWRPDGRALPATTKNESVVVEGVKNDAGRNYAILRVAQENVRKRLKDPDSASFTGLFIGKSGVPCGEVNSKNSFGGYTGYQRFVASGGGLAFLESDMPPEEFEKTWSQLCR